MNYLGKTPLDLAVEENNINTVDILMKHFVRYHLQAWSKLTILKWFCLVRHCRMLLMF